MFTFSHTLFQPLYNILIVKIGQEIKDFGHDTFFTS